MQIVNWYIRILKSEASRQGRCGIELPYGTIFWDCAGNRVKLRTMMKFDKKTIQSRTAIISRDGQ